MSLFYCTFSCSMLSFIWASLSSPLPSQHLMVKEVYVIFCLALSHPPGASKPSGPYVTNADDSHWWFSYYRIIIRICINSKNLNLTGLTSAWQWIAVALFHLSLFCWIFLINALSNYRQPRLGCIYLTFEMITTLEIYFFSEAITCYLFKL